MSVTIPITVVSGYLGAGKTTLINQLLREACGLQIAVLVNDFGALPIDADLIVSRSGDVMHLAGGCICCSFGSDLVGALVDMSQRQPAPDHVIVETSGISLPEGITRSIALLGALSLRSVLVLADARNVRAHAGDPFIGDTIHRQLMQADTIVVNKVDAVDASELPVLRNWVAAVAPEATVIEAVQGAVSTDVLAGRGGGTRRVFADALKAEVSHEPDARYESVALAPAGPIDVAAFGQALCDPHCGVLRAKGLLYDVDGTLNVLQNVDRTSVVTRHQGSSDCGAGIVCIGLRGRLNRSRIVEAFEAARVALLR